MGLAVTTIKYLLSSRVLIQNNHLCVCVCERYIGYLHTCSMKWKLITDILAQ